MPGHLCYCSSGSLYLFLVAFARSGMRKREGDGWTEVQGEGLFGVGLSGGLQILRGDLLGLGR